MTEQSIAEPRDDPRDTLDSDWNNALNQIHMVHRRVMRDRMNIRLSSVVHARRADYASGIIRMIREIIDFSEIDRQESSDD